MKKYLLCLLISAALGSCKDDNDKSVKSPQSLTGEALPEWMTPRINEINTDPMVPPLKIRNHD